MGGTKEGNRVTKAASEAQIAKSKVSSLTWMRSEVQVLYRPPLNPALIKAFARPPVSSRIACRVCCRSAVSTNQGFSGLGGVLAAMLTAARVWTNDAGASDSSRAW